MIAYTAPQRDMKFALFDVIGAEKLYAHLGIAFPSCVRGK